MSRSRYWKLTADEVEGLTYDPKKILIWEIKGIREPEEDAKFIGIFQYRNGSPMDYEEIHGIVYYHNNIERKDLPAITKFLKDRFDGKEIEKGERIFLKDSKEIYTGKEISKLAKEFESKFNVKTEITLEFEDMTQDEQSEAGLPEAKLLPIPGK